MSKALGGWGAAGWGQWEKSGSGQWRRGSGPRLVGLPSIKCQAEWAATAALQRARAWAGGPVFGLQARAGTGFYFPVVTEAALWAA